MSTIAYYITSHGFGHAIRSVTIANAFSPATEVIFRTAIPEDFFKREMRRPFRRDPAVFDCGCLQADGVTVSIGKTVERYRELADRNRNRLGDEVRWCRENNVDIIVSDITPFAFDAARQAGIPSVAVTNFTWFDIYAEYVTEFPDFLPYLQEIRCQYATATLALALSPACTMDYFPNIRSVPVVGRKGAICREAILHHYRCSDAVRKLALIYIGDFGMNGIDWQKLDRFSEWLFLGIHELPGASANYRCVDFTRFRYEDVIASSDCMFSKLGYGVVSECMINATPLVFLPREHFAEYPVLRDAVNAWGGGVELSQEHFLAMDWATPLEYCAGMSGLEAIAADGASVCSTIIESTVGGRI